MFNLFFIYFTRVFLSISSYRFEQKKTVSYFLLIELHIFNTTVRLYTRNVYAKRYGQKYVVRHVIVHT